MVSPKSIANSGETSSYEYDCLHGLGVYLQSACRTRIKRSSSVLGCRASGPEHVPQVCNGLQVSVLSGDVEEQTKQT
eukprot:1190265-Prorocentrum_minimum.AAC.2